MVLRCARASRYVRACPLRQKSMGEAAAVEAAGALRSRRLVRSLPSSEVFRRRSRKREPATGGAAPATGGAALSSAGSGAPAGVCS